MSTTKRAPKPKPLTPAQLRVLEMLSTSPKSILLDAKDAKHAQALGKRGLAITLKQDWWGATADGALLWQEGKLRERRPAATIAASKGAADVAPKQRSKPDDKFKGLPGHDLARFLDAELGKRKWSANDLFKALQAQGFDKKDDDTVYKWVKGQSTPRFNDLATLAAALGYRDWFALIAAIGRYTAR